MKKFTLTIVAAFIVMVSFGQQVTNFSGNDCENSTAWDLYTELGNGYACVLDFMATWCGPCAAATPALNSIYVDYGGPNSTTLRMWALDCDDTEDCSKINNLTASWGGTYPSLATMNSTYSFYNNLYGSGGIPFIVTIIPNTSNPDQSTVEHYQVGWAAWVEQDIRDALAANGHFPVNIASSTADAGVHVYPNPSSDQMTVSINKTADMQIDIYNVVGQKVETVFNGHVAGQMNVKVDVSSYTAGVYFVQIIEGDNVETIKISVN